MFATGKGDRFRAVVKIMYVIVRHCKTLSTEGFIDKLYGLNKDLDSIPKLIYIPI